jgi:20S proteasome subunit beta 7
MIATGFGSHLALPILRSRWRADLDEGEARALLEDCLRVLFYRDCRALDRVQIAKVSKHVSLLFFSLSLLSLSLE